MLIQGQVGLVAAQTGANPNLGLGRFGDALVSSVSDRYSQLAAAGYLYTIDTGAAITVTTTGTSPLPAGTGIPILGILNPANSGVNYHVLKAGVANISGTPAGPLLWNYATSQTTITAASNVTAVCTKLGGGAGTSKCWAGTTTTGSSAGVLLRTAFDMAGITLLANDGTPAPFLHPVDGEIIIPPGGYLALAGTTTGTTHVVRAAVVFAELPV